MWRVSKRQVGGAGTAEKKRMSRQPGGRRVCVLGNVLCVVGVVCVGKVVGWVVGSIPILAHVPRRAAGGQSVCPPVLSRPPVLPAPPLPLPLSAPISL